jgi:hypothetical protein
MSAVTRRVLAVVLAACALGAVAPAPAAMAAPRVAAHPKPIAFGEILTITGRGWPVIEFCSRRVQLSLRTAQNVFRVGTVRTRLNGRFRREFVPRAGRVGAGRWRLVARMRCESGKDGSTIIQRASASLRIVRR